ncbi:MAG TPA: hypothetical protein VJN64_06810 [Terriglobales bacterium]|nr:hypothetical protein [Terriglobales bacterium]
MAVSLWKFFSDAAAESGDGCFELGDLVAGRSGGRRGCWPGRFQQAGAEEHVHGRMVAPVGKKIVDFPKRELRDLAEGPAGSGGDMAEEEGPIG